MRITKEIFCLLCGCYGVYLLAAFNISLVTYFNNLSIMLVILILLMSNHYIIEVNFVVVCRNLWDFFWNAIWWKIHGSFTNHIGIKVVFFRVLCDITRSGNWLREKKSQNLATMDEYNNNERVYLQIYKHNFMMSLTTWWSSWKW